MAPGATALAAPPPQPAPPPASPATPSPAQSSPATSSAPASPQAQPAPFTPPTNTSPMVSPEGKFGYVPNEKVSGAIDAGYEQAVQMVNPQGQKGFIGRSKLDSARQQGYKDVPAPGMVDRVGNWVNDPARTPDWDPNHPTMLGRSERFLHGLGAGPINTLLHPIQAAESAGQATLASGANPNISGVSLAAPIEGSATGQQASAQNQQAQQSAQQDVTAQTQEMKRDPYEAAGELLGTAAATHLAGEVIKGTVHAAQATATGIKNSSRGFLENVTGANEAVRKAGENAAGDQIKIDQAYQDALEKNHGDVQKAKQAAADKNAEIDAENTRVQNNRQARVDAAKQAADQTNQKASADVEAWNDKQKLDHANKVAEISAQNLAEQNRTDAQNLVNKVEAQRKYQENVQLAEDTETDRGELARQEIQTRLRLTRRANQVTDSARGVVNNQYSQVSKAIGPARLPLETLVDSVNQGMQEFKGSPEKVRQFNDILSHANDVGDIASQRQAIIDQRNLGGKGGNYNSLPQQYKDIVDEAIKNNKALRDSGQPQAVLEGENGTPTIGFDHIRGYSSELGKTIHSLIRTNGPGDLIKGLNIVKAHLDAMAEQLAQKAGVRNKFLRANKNWSTYMDVFKEPTGPSGSGSAVAKSLNAEDAHNATEPFINGALEEQSRARRMLVGSPESGPYYDPNAGKLIDKLKDIRSKIDELPKNPIEVKPLQEPKPVEPKLKQAPTDVDLSKKLKPTPEPVQPKPVAEIENKPHVEAKPVKPVPPKENAEPVDIQQVKAEAVINHARKLKYMDKRQVLRTLEIAGGAVTAALGHPAIGGSIAAHGIIGAVGPQILSKLIERPKFVEWLSKPGARDFETLAQLKNADKIRVQRTITDEAVRLASAKHPMTIDGRVQKFLGDSNIAKIGRAMVGASAAAGSVNRDEKKEEDKDAPILKGKNPEDEPEEESFARNKQWAKPGPYLTTLSPGEETQFQKWVKDNKINWHEGEKGYDMRGFFRAMQRGEVKMNTEKSGFDNKIHFVDKFKTPYDATFSRESQWATHEAPYWDDRDRLVRPDGQVIVDEGYGKEAQGAKP